VRLERKFTGRACSPKTAPASGCITKEEKLEREIYRGETHPVKFSSLPETCTGKPGAQGGYFSFFLEVATHHFFHAVPRRGDAQNSLKPPLGWETLSQVELPFCRTPLSQTLSQTLSNPNIQAAASLRRSLRQSL
jgi:hypothetical protein